MLTPLLGNATIERILFFLFVNRKCYGTQLSRTLNLALTPLQKGLARLEKGGILTSYFEGKTRLYQFNPAYPLLSELELLLKKGYTLLSSEEKKSYHPLHEPFAKGIKQPKSKMAILHTFWDQLLTVKRLSFKATSQDKPQRGGWHGKGLGEVEVIKQANGAIIFKERGTWKGGVNADLNFSNVFRWTFDKHFGAISLEHLRRGIDHPVFLFHLAPATQKTLTSIDAHLCNKDAYFGQLHEIPHGIRLHWRVIGPKKNGELDYVYSF